MPAGVPQRILVVGAGATGGLFGGLLAAAGRDVTFLVRPRRAAQLRETGLILRRPAGDLKVDAELAPTGRPLGTADLVLLAVKAYALNAAMEDFALAVGPRTRILPVLNGLRHLELLAARFGEQAVLGGVCRVSARLDPDGGVRQDGDEAQLTFGTPGRCDPERLETVRSVLRCPGVDARQSTDILREMWAKWVLVAAIGAVTCVMRAPVGAVAAAPGGQEFARSVVRECGAVAAAWGYPLDAQLADVATAVTLRGSNRASSMYHDLVAGAPVEADHIIGDLVARAAARHVDVPFLRLAHTHLQVYQNSMPLRGTHDG